MKCVFRRYQAVPLAARIITLKASIEINRNAVTDLPLLRITDIKPSYGELETSGYRTDRIVKKLKTYTC